MEGFDLLTPEAVLQSVAQGFDVEPEGTILPYPSYINRVYGIRTGDGEERIVKFYRPGRWSWEAVAEEHQFLEECAAAELPVITPLADADGDTLLATEIRGPGGESREFLFALYPKRGGRNFDAEGESDWLRLGRLLGRLHLVARRGAAPHRVRIHPELTTAEQVRELSGLVDPELRSEYLDLCHGVIASVAPLFAETAVQRIHGDCHRGNILERPGEGLVLIDFDDMAVGPAVQDLWLLLPGARAESGRELGLLIEGYEEFLPFPHASLALIEPLRFMRMIHFSAWCARQRGDLGFARHFADWGSRAYWIKELEDLREQALRIAGGDRI